MRLKFAAGVAVGMLAVCGAGIAAAQDFEPKQAGTWIINGRVSTVDPDGGEPVRTVAGNVDTGLDGLATSSTMPTLGFTYFLTDNLAIEAILGTTKHTVKATNLPLAETWVLPPVVAVQYHFGPDQRVSPYVGAGLNYMLFYNDENIAPFTDFDIDNGLGYALQAGVDVAIQGPWALNLDVKKVYFETTVNTTLPGTGALASDVNLDPWVISAGLGRRW